MDWNPSFEQELQQIHRGNANQQQQHEPEYGYHVQQPQQQYSSLFEDSRLALQYVSTIPFGQRLTAALGYAFGWVTGFVFFLFAEKRNRFVRFHALQSLLFFGGISILGLAVGAFINFGMSFNNDYNIGFILVVPLVIAWIAIMLLTLMAIAGWFMGTVNALRGRYYKMPFVGGFVERYINRQAIPK